MAFIIGLLLGLVVGCVITFIFFCGVLAKFNEKVNGELNNLIEKFSKNS